MKNVTTFYNNEILDNNENSYLYFSLGESKYAVNIKQVVEIMKLPLLDYPQKLPNNIVGLLNYNDFTINILDLRFYLDIKVTPYSILNQLLIVKTDETIFGLIIDKTEDIIAIDQSKVEYLQVSMDRKIIEFIYKHENGTISVINLNAIEELLKQDIEQHDIDIPSLFPNDDDSRYKLMQRAQILQEKFDINAVTNIFSHDKFISFSLDENTYCIDLKYVKEFLKNISITPLPCNKDYIAGVTALRGDFINIIDLKNYLNESNKSHSNVDFIDSKNQVIIIQVPDFTVGFLVDKIYGIINIAEDLIKKDSQYDKYILSEAFLNDELYTILDIKNILSDEKFFIEE